MRILTLFLCSAHGAVALSPLSTKASLQGHELAGPTPVHDGANTSVVWQHSAEVRAAAASNLVALRHRAQSGLMESAALLRTAHLNPRAVVVSLMLDIAVIGCSFLYVHYHWAEWTKMSQAASASRGGIVDEVLKQIIQLFDRNKEAIEGIVNVCVEFPIFALFPTLGVLSILELLLSASLAHEGCSVPLIGWMQVDAVVALGCAGIAWPAFAVVKACLADPLQVAHALRKWSKSGAAWPALLDVLLPGRQLNDYQVVCASLFASAAFMLSSFLWSIAGVAILCQGFFSLCSLQTFATALLLVALRFALSTHWVSLVWKHRATLLYGEEQVEDNEVA